MGLRLAPRGFEEGDVVATGAFARVLRVTRDARSFGCRRLTTRGLAEPEARARVAKEAEVLEALAGRGAPRLVESGEDEGGPFIVYEWAPGETLAVCTQSARAPDALARVARASFEALATVHDAKVVHGDVRPDNVIVASDLGTATLIDFTLAREGDAPVAPGSAFAGTLAYAAPEVARGEPSGPAADVFALAMCVLELATGAPPRAGKSAAELLLAAGGAPPAVPHGGPHGAVLDAIRTCFSDSPADRPSARDVAQSLAALC
jgi:serine/threonine protein kinase